MDADWIPIVVPLGRRLQRAADRIRAATRFRPTWLAAGDEVIDRLAVVTLPLSSRYERIPVSELALASDRRVAAALGEPPASDEPTALPAVVRDRLTPVVGQAATEMRIHQDERADRLARQHGADAVTIGRNVHFRRGRYQPHDRHGVALLAHEATHVSRALRPNAGWHQGLMVEAGAEEAAATRVEGLVRARGAQGMGAAPGAERPPVATGRRGAPAGSPLAPPARPMTASTDRAVETAAPAAAPFDMNRLRQALARDLMQQIRSELERGG